MCLSPYPLPPCHSLLSNDLLIFMIISSWVYLSRTFLLEYNHEKFFFITLNPLFFPVSSRYHLLQYIFCNEIISICKMVMQQLGSFSNNLTKKKKQTTVSCLKQISPLSDTWLYLCNSFIKDSMFL